MLVCQGPSFYLKSLVDKGPNSKTIAFGAMTLVLQLHLFIMIKYSKLGVDTFNTFLSNGGVTLKFLHDDYKKH